MSLPISHAIENPILQELSATGGADDVKFLYGRLTAYFPQITDAERLEIKNGTNKSWRVAIQKAAKMLDEKGFLTRRQGFWTITERGRKIALEENSGFTLTVHESAPASHTDIQKMLAAIGSTLGFETALEFEFYDVVWRERQNQSRLSHVFEVQSKGNIDSAFAKLKRAFQHQRSKPFLILSSERDLNRARQSLTREFSDIADHVTILTFAQIAKLHRSLDESAEIIEAFLLL